MHLIVSPHLDDAVLSLGGLLAKEGHDSVVVTFFAGTPLTPLTTRWDTKCGFKDSSEAMSARTEENRKSLHLFGISDDRIRNFAHLDAEYRVNGKISEQTLEASIAEEIDSLLKEFTSSPLTVFVPGLELHADHAIVKRAALAVARKLPEGSPHIFSFYQDIPYAFKVLESTHSRTWNKLTNRNPRWWNYSLLESEITGGAFSVSRNSIPLSSTDMEKKLAGTALYTSQVPHVGKHLLKKIERFAAAQSRSLSLGASYCEVTYTLTTEN